MDRFTAFLFLGLIATLPLYSLRILPGNTSLPLLFFIGLALTVALRALSNLRIPASFTAIDRGIALYLIAALATLLYSATAETTFAIIKSFVYFLSYLGLKIALAGFSADRLRQYTRTGIVIGTILFPIIALLALARTNSLSILLSEFSYNSVTVRVFSAIDVAFGQDRESFVSVDVMRNSVAEAFALYATLSLTLGFRRRLLTIVMASANTIFTMGMFSRRALVAVCFGALSGSRRRSPAMRKVSIIAVLLIGAALLTMDATDGARLTDFSDQARVEQYGEALQRFAAAPILGNGFGAKLSSGKYVHNFVLAGMMMMGILGLMTTVAIFFSVVSEFIRGLRTPNRPWTVSLLIIPILGMAIGSTVEGIFTLTGWLALALHDICRRNLAASSGMETNPKSEPKMATTDG